MDGVLTNSAILGGIEAVNALRGTEPSNRILSLEATELAYPGFEKAINQYRPFLVHGHEFLAICAHFRETSPNVESREQFETEVAKYRDKVGDSEYNQFCLAFTDVRSCLPYEHSQEIINLLIVYIGIRNIINAAKENGPVYVSSSNQMAQKRLKMLGFDINEENIFTKATHGKKKADHLREIAEREGVGLEDITMIEDSLPEVIRLHDLGVNLVMAPWGYNTEKQQEAAARLGATVLDQENLLELIRSC